MKTKGTVWATALVTVSAALVVPACSRTVDGQGAASTTVSSSTASTTAAAPTSTTTTAAAAPTTTTTPPSVDEVVANAITETQSYWELLGDVETEFRVEQISAGVTCNDRKTRDGTVMYYCDGVPGDNALRWEHALTAALAERGGNDAVTFAIAHEVTHAAQDADGREYPSRDAKEASADCGAGAYAAYSGADKAQADVAVKAIPQWDGARQRHFDYGWGKLVDPNECLDYTG